ncbi:MAG: class II histone deacetylase [Solirubrobacteraceae bacterium]
MSDRAGGRGPTGWLFDERYLWHDTGTAAGLLASGGWLQPLAHVESAATKGRLQSLLAVSGLLDELVAVRPRAATVDELLAVHTAAYLERLQALSSGGGGDAGDGTTPFGQGGFEIAALSAGGAIAALEAVVSGAVSNVYALVRPPGHHALPDRGMGFCMLNNIAVAVRHAQRALGVGRIAIVDWDVHHGNGTQAIFYEDPSVLTISIHQDGCYPLDSGSLTERGAGPAVGANLNVALPPGAGHGAYVAAFERVVIPTLARFEPELVVIASGFDASAYDPMGRMLLHSDSYRELTGMMVEETGGRLAVIHEGGYSEFYVPFCGLAVMETLAGRRTDVVDPYLEETRVMAGQELTDSQRALLDSIVAGAGLR